MEKDVWGLGYKIETLSNEQIRAEVEKLFPQILQTTGKKQNLM